MHRNSVRFLGVKANLEEILLQKFDLKLIFWGETLALWKKNTKTILYTGKYANLAGYVP